MFACHEFPRPIKSLGEYCVPDDFWVTRWSKDHALELTEDVSRDEDAIFLLARIIC